jgi:hypothetical protein
MKTKLTQIDIQYSVMSICKIYYPVIFISSLNLTDTFDTINYTSSVLLNRSTRLLLSI